MANSYGLTALMEAMNHIDKEERNLDEITDVATGTLESVTFMDAVDAGLINDFDEEVVEDEMEDVMDEVDPDDPEINKMLDQIDPTEDDEEVDLESLDMALEAYLETVEEEVHRTVSDYHVSAANKHVDKLKHYADKYEDENDKDDKDDVAFTAVHHKNKAESHLDRAESSAGSKFKSKY